MHLSVLESNTKILIALKFQVNNAQISSAARGISINPIEVHARGNDDENSHRLDIATTTTTSTCKISLKRCTSESAITPLVS
ncbi:hypothetical protein QE152_g19592 [Popillia japonica]|uniref:Uncharacterized protein n=1 Tax=Popillia japonica TaxID=7064 RepID=A0AAW1KPV0_POPJA